MLVGGKTQQQNESELRVNSKRFFFQDESQDDGEVFFFLISFWQRLKG